MLAPHNTHNTPTPTTPKQPPPPSFRTLIDPAAAQSFVANGQRRRPPDRGPGGSGGAGRGGGGGTGGSRIVGFSEMKDMGNPPCGGGG
jgi:hypothetical protein